MKALAAILTFVCSLGACAAPDAAVTAETPASAPPPASVPTQPSATPAKSEEGPGVAPGIPASTLEAVSAIADGSIDALGRDGKSIGLAVGIWTPKFQSTQGYGRTSAGATAVPDGDSVFELGSVTKVFSGMLLADRVLAGRMNLDDALGAHLPKVTLPSFAGQPITLGNLASHGSGLPSMPDNLAGDKYNPAAGYTRERLANFLARTKLPRSPGSQYEYSNVGIGLLGLALSQEAGGATFEAMVADTITGPLQMSDTRIDRAAYPSAKLVQGHQGTTPVPANQIDVLEASGALRSTARDMVKLLAVLAGTGHPLDKVVALTETRVIDKASGGSCGLAFEIRTDAGTTYFEKSGATSGFTARIVVSRSPAVGIVVLSNSARADLNDVAQRMHGAVRAAL
jgi:serine-type D-Ala-D-Ala carboxypeptidase/endopeptidase